MSTLRVNNLTDAGGTGPTYAPGHIIQVVNFKYSTTVTNATSGWIDTGLSATITPKSTSSKILVVVSQNGLYKTNGSATNGINLRLMRGATALDQFSFVIGYTGTAIELHTGSASFEVLDSPTTISPVTYTTQFSNFAATSAVVCQSGNPTSSITLMEVAA